MVTGTTADIDTAGGDLGTEVNVFAVELERWRDVRGFSRMVTALNSAAERIAQAHTFGKGMGDRGRVRDAVGDAVRLPAARRDGHRDDQHGCPDLVGRRR